MLRRLLYWLDRHSDPSQGLFVSVVFGIVIGLDIGFFVYQLLIK
jgi:hypothetical protein